MSAKPHFNLPGLAQLIIQKANSSGPCFFVDKDYQQYLHELQNRAADYNCHIHAYLLLPDQIQILATPYADNGIYSMMQTLSRHYLAYINKTYGNSDTLWQGDYQSCLIDSEQWLISCMHYIEQNPALTNMHMQAGDYAWSSYHRNALNITDTVIKPHPLYTALANTDKGRGQVYTSLFQPQLSGEIVQTIRDTLKQQQILGRASFKAKIKEITSKEKAKEGGWDCAMFY